MRKTNIRTIQIGKTFISEITVFDEETNSTYYVVVSLGYLLYATFKSSYLDYILDDIEEPEQVEGNNYLWFDLLTDRGETPYYRYYAEAYNNASQLKHKRTLSVKYAHIKKPLNNLVYKVMDRKKMLMPGCGPATSVYELKIHLLDSDTYLYVYADDYAYGISKESIFKAIDKNKDVSWIEEITSFNKAKKSQYYDLYLEMEKYIDGYDD